MTSQLAFKRTAVALIVCCFLNGVPVGAQESETPRLVVLGGGVAEAVYALGAGEWVVGADQSCQYPPQVLEVPRLNYHRTTSAEAVLAQNPTVVLHTVETGPPTALEQLRSAGVTVVEIPTASNREGAEQKIAALGAVLNKQDEAAALNKNLNEKLDATLKRVSAAETKPRVLFLYARQGLGAPMVGGVETPADELIRLAGGQNAAADITGFRPLTPEALVMLQPDAVFMLDKGLQALGGESAIWSLPGMAQTTAGKEKNLITMADDLAFSFGPRLPEAVEKLANALHPELTAQTAETGQQF